MKKGFWKVWFSENRGVYIRIAFCFRSTPWRVYDLAHGRRSKSYEDIQILKKLEEEGIIIGINPW